MKELEAWVTSAVEDKDVDKVLVLARSLRRSMTAKNLIVVASSALESKHRYALAKDFDQVFCLDHNSVNGWIGLRDYAMLYCFNLTLFKKCVYLAPEILVLKNADELFQSGTKFNAVVSRTKDGDVEVDTSVFSFAPSVEVFERLIISGKRFLKENVGHFEKYMKRWLLNQKSFGKLDPKYNFELSEDSVSTDDFSIVKLSNQMLEKLLSSGYLEYDGIMESAIVKYWKDLYEQDKLGQLCPMGAKLTNEFQQESNYLADLTDAVAVIGISCRHAGARNFDEFWKLLINGESGICTVPMDRWTKEHGCKAPPSCESTLGGFLTDPIDQFDSKFFGISPKEMEFVDPQQRLLLEVTWEALENAGIDPLTLQRTHTGVFVGAWMDNYKNLLSLAECDEFYRIYMGNSFGAAAARLSFFLGLTGPSCSTESGCSSAMQSVDLACKSLRSGETSLSLACGVNLILRPFNKDTMSFVIAGDGRCKTFDADADGFGRAEGCGVLVLKRYVDAVKDGDHVWALIRGSSCTQEGLSRSMGTPTLEVEALAMSLALKDAGVDPEDVSFVEAHGTGTSLGDPLEISAIAEVYGGIPRDEPLVVGSGKVNVGHTESCSAITGIVKVIASLQHEIIPPHINLKKLNPKINLEAIPARIPLEPIAWPRKRNKPRLAGVSSFGITGTDGHLIIQEAPQVSTAVGTFSVSNYLKVEDRPLHIMKLSARTEEALDNMILQYQKYLEANETSFSDICFTANVGRANFPHRAVLIAKDNLEAHKMLQAKKFMRSEAPETSPGKICFLFTGQGAQYAGMSKQLYDSNLVFRMNFDKCHKILKDAYGLNMKASLWGNNATEALTHSLYSQTGIFCVEYCLLQVWESWGIKPDYVMGHSLGEFCAAVAAKVLSLEDALKLVAERSRLVESLPKGKMLVLKADKKVTDMAMKEYAKSIPDFWLDYAAENSKEQTVLAGQSEHVEAFAEFCTLKKSMKCMVLEASHAFHSRLMDPILEQYKKAVETIRKTVDSTASSCKFISGVYGKLMERTDPTLVSPKYWIDHTREKVNFVEACQAVTMEECNFFVEIGPQPILSALVVGNSSAAGMLTCVPSIRRNEENWNTILSSLGKLYLSGFTVNWRGFDKFYLRSKLPSLPTYPFQRKKHWFDTQNMKGHGSINLGTETIHPLLGSIVPNASGIKIFQSSIDIRKRVEWIKDHCVGKRIIFPGAAYLEMALASGHCVTEGLTDTFCKPSGPVTIENMKILAPLALDDKVVCQLQVVLHTDFTGETENDGMKVQVFRQHSMEGEAPKWIEHCKSYFTPAPVDFDELTFRDTFNLATIRKECVDKVDISELYEKLSEVGLKFGTSFQSMKSIWKGGNGILAEARAPADDKDYIVHPVLLDAMLQAAMVAQSKGHFEDLHVPISITKFTWLQHEDADSCTEGGSEYFIYSCAQNNSGSPDGNNPEDMISVLFSSNETTGNKIIAFMKGMEFAKTSVSAIESHLDSQKTDLPTLHNEVWRPQLGPNQSRVTLMDIFTEDILNEKMVDVFRERANELDDIDLEREALLQKLSFGHVLNAFHELGWDPKEGDAVLLDKFIQDYKILEQHRKLLRYNMTMFVDEGILVFTGEYEWKVAKRPPSLLETQQLIKNTKMLLGKYENLANAIQIYTSVGSNYAPILQGKVSALSILFPQDPSKPSAESFYTESYSYSNMDRYTVNHFKTLLKPYDPNNKSILRILEVGAGTGNFTRDILGIFRDHGIGIEYTFTDISPAFFINAAKKFEEFKDIIKYRVLNVEYDAKQQGFSPEYFDLVVGADVFHATKSLTNSISNVRQLIRPGGVLCLIEGVRQNHITCIFGLLQGYWRFTDTDIREHHPLVSADTWKSLCLNNGFDDCVSIPCASDYYAFVLARASNEVTRIPQSISYSEGKWLVFPTLENESKYLVNKLSVYRPVVTVWRSLTYQESEDGTGFGINVNNKEHMMKMLQSIRGQSNSSHVEGIVYLWGSSTGPNADQSEIAQPFLHLCQAVVEMKQHPMPKIFLITNGIYSIGDHPCENPASSTLWGIAKSCANEMNIRIKMIDLCSASQNKGTDDCLENGRNMVWELWNDVPELFIAYRANTRYTCRLMKTKLTEVPLKLPQNDRYHLILPQSKAISDLRFGILGKYALKPDEIEVKVKSAALNFRDVFAVLKPDAQFDSINVIGSDFAGVVSAVGSQVTKWQIGDSVFGCNLEDGALPSHVRIIEDAVVRKPDSWTYSEACGLPAVFATAFYSLVTIAKMKSGDTVLIHTASGGVGLSAIQICQQIGAKIIATAGSCRKRAYLKSIGVRHVFHSRNTKYEQDIMKVTDGRGVDIVLNSLTGPGFKEASLNACARNARFVEMSKLTIWQSEEVKLLRPDVDYTIVDLTSVPRAVWKMLFDTLDEYLKQEMVKPIPYVRFDGVCIREALTYLQKAKHIGKIVCVMPEVKFQSGQYISSTPLFNPESTYLITGGLGGIGFEVCKWMLESGANNLVIISRSQPKERHMQVINALRSQNKNIITKAVDVGDYTMCKNLIKYINDELPPLRGIMHCAGVLSDATLINQTWEKFQQTFRPKLKGAWNLHELTRDCNLEHFVMFSSMAALFGPPGQSNHAAGNGYLDAFTYYRDSIGLPATTINWGQWGQVGVAAGREVRGVAPFSPARGLAALEAIMKSQNRAICVVDLDYQVIMKVHPQSKLYMQHLAGSGSSSDGSMSSAIKSEKFWEELDSAKEGEKEGIIKQYVKVLLRQILKLDEEEPIDDKANFQDMGLDSLMMIELKNNLQTILGSRMTLAASALADCTNIELLTDKLLQLMDEMNTASSVGHTLENKLDPEEMWKLIDEDSILPDTIQFNGARRASPPSKAKTYLLTGVTGNLGPYVLKEMLKYGQVEKVYCLMRKSMNPQQRLNQLLNDLKINGESDLKKIKVVIGDLASPKFGMVDADYDSLSDEVDSVIHCAVRSNHVESYGKNMMRTINVFGTMRVLEFCGHLKVKQLFHASSIVAVATTDENGCLSEDWPIENELKGVTDLGYPLSKMVCDKLIHQAINRGLCAKVFRFGGLLGSSESGRFKAHNNHIMLRFLCYMKLGAMPSIPVPAFLLPVDLAANASVQIFFDKKSSTSDIYNLCHPTPALEQEFPVLAQEFGYEVELVDYNEFVNRFASEGEDSLLYPFRELYENEERYNAMCTFPDAIRKWLENPDKFFAITKVTKLIPDYTENMQSTWEYVRRDLLYAKSTGLFQKFKLDK